jgi:hypothetical protein
VFCSSCGAAVPKDLSYCNHCGALLNSGRVTFDNRPVDPFPESLVWAIVAIFTCGIGSVIGLTAVMKNYGLNDGAVLGFGMLILVMTLIIESVFVGLLFSRKKAARQASEVERAAGKKKATSELVAAQPRALGEPLTSVTEHTTRSFEPIYRERKIE